MLRARTGRGSPGAQERAVGMMLSMRADGASQRILIVDDDIAIHRVVEKVLTIGRSKDPSGELDAASAAPPSSTRRPYQLTFAKSGQEAVLQAERAQRQGTPFGVALVDMRMPGWDGIETATRLYRVEPQLQLAFCSAYMDYSWQEVLDRLQRPGLRQLRKPWTSGQILALVHELCQRAQTGGTGPMAALPFSKPPLG